MFWQPSYHNGYCRSRPFGFASLPFGKFVLFLFTCVSKSCCFKLLFIALMFFPVLCGFENREYILASTSALFYIGFIHIEKSNLVITLAK